MSLVTTVDRGAVRVITYANPPFGTMTATGSTEMFHAVVAAGEDQSVRVVVITGGLPGIFIRHYDVGELSDAADAVQSVAPRGPSASGPRPPGFHALTDMIATVEKPIIAAINGLCMGGGFELSLVRPSHHRKRGYGNRFAGDPHRHLSRWWRYPTLAQNYR